MQQRNVTEVSKDNNREYEKYWACPQKRGEGRPQTAKYCQNVG